MPIFSGVWICTDSILASFHMRFLLPCTCMFICLRVLEKKILQSCCGLSIGVHIYVFLGVFFPRIDLSLVEHHDTRLLCCDIWNCVRSSICKNRYSTERCSWHGIWSALQFHHCILAAKIYAGMNERSSCITEVVFFRAQLTKCSGTETWWPQAYKMLFRSSRRTQNQIKEHHVLGHACWVWCLVCVRAHLVGACVLCSCSGLHEEV